MNRQTYMIGTGTVNYSFAGLRQIGSNLQKSLIVALQNAFSNRITIKMFSTYVHV